MFSRLNSPAACLTRRAVAPGLSFSLFALALLGCASPGIPRPPSLNLSRPATDLSARRIGDTVVLAWTAPDRTTDNLDLKGLLTARICRIPAPAPTPPSCLQVASLPAKPGPSTATDTLPPAFTAEPATLLEYSVEIVNSAGRSAGPSAPVYAASGTAPSPVEGLHATAIPTGVMLEWSPPPANFLTTSVELDRLDNTLQANQQSQTKSPKPLQLAGKPTPQTHLRAQSTTSNPQSAAETPGILDNTAHFGDTYTYTAQRRRIVQLEGHSLTLQSSVSAPVIITPRDIFPPAVPTGLVAIPNNRTPVSIDLSWQPNSDPDLAGYLVYRYTLQAIGRSTPTRLTASPIPGTDYRDLTATTGQRYIYTVTAIDTSNNESKPSAQIEEQLGAP